MTSRLGDQRQRSEGLAERAARSIRREIAGRKLKPGQVIATEAELASATGVSRSAIREAVGRLRGLGLVDSRQCKGLVVAQADPAAIMGLVIPSYAVDQAAFADLAEMRYAIELGSVDVAIERETEVEISQLIRLGEEFAEVAAADPRRADGIDIEFHKTILSATGNHLLKGLHYVITSFFHRSQLEFPEWNLVQATPAREHAVLAEAFAQRDVNLARLLLSKHLSGYLRIRHAAKPETTHPGPPRQGGHERRLDHG